MIPSNSVPVLFNLVCFQIWKMLGIYQSFSGISEKADTEQDQINTIIVFFHNYTMLPDLTDLPDLAFLYYFVVLFSCTYLSMSVLFMHIIN